MAEEKKTETEEKAEKLVIVGDGADETPEESVEEQLKKEKKQEAGGEEETDEKVGHSESEEDEESPEGETVEEKRERRRQERRNHRAKEERIRREHAYLLRRNEQVEKHLTEMARRLDEQENSGIDNRVGVIDSQIRDAETIHAQAVAEQDGKTATEALKLRDQLREHRQSLLGRKKKADETEETETQPPRIEPEIAREGRAWYDRNKSWFKPDLSDENSHLAKVVEDRMANEGSYDPRTPEYWQELDRRLEARGLRPKQKKGNGKVNERDDVDWGDNDEDEEGSEESRSESPRREARRTDPPPKKKSNGGPRFSVGGRERPLGKNEVFIDSERRKALEEAGLWEDEKTRSRYLKSYQSYDKENPRRTR